VSRVKIAGSLAASAAKAIREFFRGGIGPGCGPGQREHVTFRSRLNSSCSAIFTNSSLTPNSFSRKRAVVHQEHPRQTQPRYVESVPPQPFVKCEHWGILQEVATIFRAFIGRPNSGSSLRNNDAVASRCFAMKYAAVIGHPIFSYTPPVLRHGNAVQVDGRFA
jgi:hypothetical protein